jgi:hypothetical protein
MQKIAWGKKSYYGYIEEIWELNYGMSFQIPIIKCQWVKHPQGVEIDDYGFTIVDWRNVGHKDEPWVLAATVEQVFYILDLKDEKKYIVVLGNNEFSESKMWRMRKNTTNVMRCLSLWIQEGKILLKQIYLIAT